MSLSAETKRKKNGLFAAPLPKGSPTIFHKHTDQHHLLDALNGSLRIKRVISGDVSMLSGPRGDDQVGENYSQSFAQVTSLYPLNLATASKEGENTREPSREGDPICDSYRIHTTDGGSIWCLTDGCSWGARPFQAATRARDAFVAMAQAKINDCKTVREVLYVYRSHEKDVVDLTAKNREDVADAKDPGGRIGPFLGENDPDLRNLAFVSQEVHEGDIIIAVSDGVHDNLDPPTLGLVPSQLGLAGDSHADWKDLPKDIACETRTRYMCEALTRIINQLSRPNPALVAKAIVTHCQEITEKSRDWMEQHPDGVLTTQTYKDFPGKMDHCSCVAIRVGQPHTNDHKQQSLRPEVFPY